MDELKPCPFCGGEAHTVHVIYARVYYIECNSCGAMMGRHYPTTSALYGDRHYNTREEAIEAWSRRTVTAMTREEAIYYFKEKLKIMDNPTASMFLCSSEAVEKAMKFSTGVTAYRFAISALREQEERNKGCDWCKKDRVLCWDSGGEEVCIAQQGKLPVLGTDDWGFAVKFCPMCGRRLEEV